MLGQDITRASPRQVTELGSAHIPEDRQVDGLLLAFPVSDNLVMNTYYLPPFSKGPVLQDKVIQETANRLIKEFDIRTPNAQVEAGSLLGR